MIYVLLITYTFPSKARVVIESVLSVLEEGGKLTRRLCVGERKRELLVMIEQHNRRMKG
jgi:hypothetical protein